MIDEILINVAPQETRVAQLDQGMLNEVVIERQSARGVVGNIYSGKVVRVLPGMQAAFVDIGLERAAFLHVSDIVQLDENGYETRTGRTEDVRQLVREGQQLRVQVIKDPINAKGARLTTQLTVCARYLVYMPTSNHVGISQRLESEEERNRLKTALSEAREQVSLPGGFIIRTVAEGATLEDLIADLKFLQRLWAQVGEAPLGSKPTIIYEDLPLYLRVIRDFTTEDVKKIRVDSLYAYQKLMKFASHFEPEILDCIEHYQGERPIFDMYSIEDEILRALQPRVELKSGGHIVVEQTEAMTTVDVNTGAFVGKRNLEETIFKTNLEAVTAIGRQLRLRNLGGIVILDFIDMKDVEHRRQVVRALEKVLANDYAKTSISSVSDLGLVQMTRKRTRESLEQVMCTPCDNCGGVGTVRSTETLCYEVFRELLRMARQYETEQFMVLGSPEIIDRLLDEESETVADLEELTNKRIQFQVDGAFKAHQYEIVLT